ITGSKSSDPVLQQATGNAGVQVAPVGKLPTSAIPIRQARIALWDRYGGSMPSGWTRWLLEQYHCNFSVIYPPNIDAGNLHDQYDIVLLVNGATFSQNVRPPAAKNNPEIPEKYRNHIGNLTVAKSVPRLREFLEKGGKVITLGSSAELA